MKKINPLRYLLYFMVLIIALPFALINILCGVATHYIIAIADKIIPREELEDKKIADTLKYCEEGIN